MPMQAREGDAAEAARQIALKHLDAVRPDADQVLQEIVDGARALLDD